MDDKTAKRYAVVVPQSDGLYIIAYRSLLAEALRVKEAHNRSMNCNQAGVVDGEDVGFAEVGAVHAEKSDG